MIGNVIPIAMSYPNWEYVSLAYPDYLNSLGKTIYTTNNPASLIPAIGGSTTEINRFYSLCTATFLLRGIDLCILEITTIKASVVLTADGLLICANIQEYELLIYSLMAKETDYYKREIGYALYKILAQSFYPLCNKKKLILMPDNSYIFGDKNESDHQDKLLLTSL